MMEKETGKDNPFVSSQAFEAVTLSEIESENNIVLIIFRILGEHLHR